MSSFDIRAFDAAEFDSDELASEENSDKVHDRDIASAHLKHRSTSESPSAPSHTSASPVSSPSRHSLVRQLKDAVTQLDKVNNKRIQLQHRQRQIKLAIKARQGTRLLKCDLEAVQTCSNSAEALMTVTNVSEADLAGKFWSLGIGFSINREFGGDVEVTHCQERRLPDTLAAREAWMVHAVIPEECLRLAYDLLVTVDLIFHDDDGPVSAKTAVDSCRLTSLDFVFVRGQGQPDVDIIETGRRVSVVKNFASAAESAAGCFEPDVVKSFQLTLPLKFLSWNMGLPLMKYIKDLASSKPPTESMSLQCDLFGQTVHVQATFAGQSVDDGGHFTIKASSQCWKTLSQLKCDLRRQLRHNLLSAGSSHVMVDQKAVEAAARLQEELKTTVEGDGGSKEQVAFPTDEYQAKVERIHALVREHVSAKIP